MAHEVNTGTTGITFGNHLQIGYRAYGTLGAYAYLTYVPSFNELPYTFSLPTAGIWEIEYTEICASCSGNVYSDPQVTVVSVT